MIRIEHTSDVQKFAVTCTELATLVEPYYLFVFTNDTTNAVLKTVLTDLSTHKNRYNLFQIAGTFFPSGGWHSYKIFEQASDSNTDESAATSLVEEGRLFVDDLTNVEYIETNTQLNYKEYGG